MTNLIKFSFKIEDKIFSIGDRVWYGLYYGTSDQITFNEGYVCFGEFNAEIYTCYGLYVGDETGTQVSEAGLTSSHIVIEDKSTNTSAKYKFDSFYTNDETSETVFYLSKD